MLSDELAITVGGPGRSTGSRLPSQFFMGNKKAHTQGRAEEAAAGRCIGLFPGTRR